MDHYAHHMQHCARMYGAWTAVHGDRAFGHGFAGPPGAGFGPLEMVGVFLLASLALSLIMWMTIPRQPVQEGAVRAFLEQRAQAERYMPEATPEMWSSPPEIAQTSYEEPQASYPEMYQQRPSGERYPDT